MKRGAVLALIGVIGALATVRAAQQQPRVPQELQIEKVKDNINVIYAEVKP